MTPGVFYNCLEICVTPLKPLRFNGFSFDGLITPTLQTIASNAAGRTKDRRKLKIFGGPCLRL